MPTPPPPSTGKFSLQIDCDSLLKPGPHPPIYISKTAAEAAAYLQLAPLLSVPILHCIKIKCNHTCGRVRVDEDACFRGFFALGEWMVGEYRKKGRGASCEKVRGSGGDLSEPDAWFVVEVE